MFGLSLQKLLFTGIVVYLAWQGFKWLSRMQDRNDELARERARRIKAEEALNKSSGSAPRANPDVEEMVECPSCGSFVPAAGARNCGKSGCPYTG